MLELIAQGTQPDFRWRRPIPPNVVILLGRATHSFRVPWDDRVSRRHIRIQLLDGKLHIEKLDEAANPVFFNGHEETAFCLEPGEHFVIGHTTFTLSREEALATLDLPNPISQKSFSHEFLRKQNYRDADYRIDVLNRLPDVISSAGDEQDLLNRLLNTLLAGIGTASTIGIVQQKTSASSDSFGISVANGCHPLGSTRRSFRQLPAQRETDSAGDIKFRNSLACLAIVQRRKTRIHF